MRAGLNGFHVGVLLLVLSTAAIGQTSPPAAPQVTTGADLKRLIFDWDPVPDATYYQVLVRPWPTNPFAVLRDDIAASQTRVSLPIASHLIYWDYIRYEVAACNAAGCTSSDEIAVNDQMLDTIGYFKASNTDAGDSLGQDVALSFDGQTLAVTAKREASSATGVGGDQAANDSPGSGAVYVYRRSGGKWRQVAARGVSQAGGEPARTTLRHGRTGFRAGALHQPRRLGDRGGCESPGRRWECRCGCGVHLRALLDG